MRNHKKHCVFLKTILEIPVCKQTAAFDYTKIVYIPLPYNYWSFQKPLFAALRNFVFQVVRKCHLWYLYLRMWGEAYYSLITT